jgi:UDP-N-acetyl-D-glucosamine dehydrogenase
MTLIEKIHSKKAKVAVIGLGYVGLPLVIEFCKAEFEVLGFDVDSSKIDALKQGESYIKHIDSRKIAASLPYFEPTADFSRLPEADCILISLSNPAK